jgi:cell fate (sporulation/competence/biofilm development) regulator YmcA (YheA/YmcA/DUF963 family)
MSTDIIDSELIKKINSETVKLYKQVENKFNEYANKSNNKDLLKCLKKKYCYLKKFNISKRTKITNCKAYIYEMFLIREFKEQFSEYEIEHIYKYCISKIRGVYKHAQALKTGFCNGQIINGFSEENTISVCVTKNTLEANEQWLSRLFRELDNRYPQVSLNDKIMIISSKKNTLGGHATHCKTMNDAWSYLKKRNNFKIVFICSNKIRIQDIFEMAVSFLNLREELVKKIRIQHDEAHNIKEGIPPFRYIIENILILPNVLSYQPITASLGKIVDSKNAIWSKENLEKHAINFTDFDNTKSNDLKYSSISDYNKIKFEDLISNDCWENFNRTDVSREHFIKVEDKYKGKKMVDLSDTDLKDIDKRRKLEFCQFMINHKEIEALNNGLNSLNLNSILATQYYIKDKFNLHILSTPCRKIISQELCLIASNKDYNPIVLGIYGNQGYKYYLFMKGKDEICVDDIMGEGEFNCKLNTLIKYLKSNGRNTNRPFIIIGNYTPTGESLTYVNYEYGTVRGVIRLCSTNAEEDYQSACRGNYMNTKFLEHDKEWIAPEKFLIGHKIFINNALSYEIENDARIDYLTESNNDINLSNIVLPSINAVSINNVNGTTAIPMQIIVDTDDENYEKLMEIANKTRRTEDEKKKFLELLKESKNNPESTFEVNDKTGKFCWGDKKQPKTGMRLKDFRCYKKDCRVTKGYWKFKNYQNNFETEISFINNTSNHTNSQCEVLVCQDKYILKDDTGDVIEKNSKTIWWIGYKY